MTVSQDSYVRDVVEGVFAFIECIVLPSIQDIQRNLEVRFALHVRGTFRAGVFHSRLHDRYEIYLTTGLAAETYAAIQSLPAPQKRFLRKQLPKIRTSRTRDFALGFTFASAMTFVVAHEISHVLAGHVDFFDEARQVQRSSEAKVSDVDPSVIRKADAAPSDAASKIREIEADGFATFLLYEFRHALARSCSDDDITEQAFGPESLNEVHAQGLSRLSLFGQLLFAILLERHHEESDAAGERPGFAHARLIYICVGHMLLERPDLAKYNQASRRIVFQPENRDRLTEYFVLTVLPVLICCQRAADAAGIHLKIVPLSGKAGDQEAFLVTDIAAIISGQNPGGSAGGEELTRLGDQLASWCEGIQWFRLVRTHT